MKISSAFVNGMTFSGEKTDYEDLKRETTKKNILIENAWLNTGKMIEKEWKQALQEDIIIGGLDNEN